MKIIRRVFRCFLKIDLTNTKSDYYIKSQNDIFYVYSYNLYIECRRWKFIKLLFDIKNLSIKFYFNLFNEFLFSFLQITGKIKGLELNVIISANIKSTIAIILSLKTSL